MQGQLANSRGYLLVHSDWYEYPAEIDMLRRNAIVLTLSPQTFKPDRNVAIVKRGFAILEPPDVLPFSYTICDCRPITGRSTFDRFEEAQERLRELGVRTPQTGFNPVQ